MGCGCNTKIKKTNDKETQQYEVLETGKSFNFNEKNVELPVLDFIVKNLIKIVGFTLSLLLLPIIMIAVIWFLFQLLVLNQEIDMKKIFTAVTSKLRRFNEDYEDELEDDEDDEDEIYDEEHYETLDVEDITPSPIK